MLRTCALAAGSSIGDGLGSGQIDMNDKELGCGGARDGGAWHGAGWGRAGEVAGSGRGRRLSGAGRGTGPRVGL